MIIQKTIDYDVLGEKAVLAKVREVRQSVKYPDKLMYICDLFDANGKVLASDRYVYDDLFIPEVKVDEKEYLSGELPTDKWTVDTIKLYLDDRATTDEDGEVVSLYTTKDTKETLLAKALPVEAEK